MTKRKLELREWMDKHENEYVQYVVGICEPGYDDKQTLLANWNNVTTDDLKYASKYNQEWEDEWIECDDCHKIFRCSPDSYSWQMFGHIYDGFALCGNCMDKQEYLESIENHPTMALTSTLKWHWGDLSQYGYELVQEGFENGFYPGQNDDPKKILADLLAVNPNEKYIFVMDGQGQFDIDFSIYRRVNQETE